MVCPYLGVMDDPETSFANPSFGNFCYRANPVQSVSLLHQEHFCLSSQHTSCKVFTSQQPIPLSDEMAGGDMPTQSIFSSIYLRAAFVLGAVLIVIAALFLALGPGKPMIAAMLEPVLTATILPVVYLSPSATPTLQPTLTATQTPVAPTATQPPSPTPTNTPTMIAGLPTPGPIFGTAFGPDKQFVLYQIQEGESISNIARTYGTTLEVIRLVNQVIEGASIQPGTVLVIIRDLTDISQATPFYTFQVQTDTSVKALAAEKNVSEEILNQYNDLDSSNLIPAGRWLIIPVQ